MPQGESYKNTVRWPSAEFAQTYADVCATLNTNRNERIVVHALEDIERYGTPEQRELARAHLAGRARTGPKPKHPDPDPDPADVAKVLDSLDELAQSGVITREEWQQKRRQVLRIH